MTRISPETDLATAPAKKRGFGRFLRRSFGWLLLLLIVAGLSALYFRLDLVNRLAPTLLTDRLAVPTELGMSRLDWRQSRIDNIRLGESGALTIEGITLAYDPWTQALERVEIDRVSLRAAYAEGFTLGELDPLIAELQNLLASSESDADAPTRPLPTILVKTIEVELQSPAGLLRGNGQATLDNQAVIANFSLAEPRDLARIDADIALSLATDGAPPSGALRMSLAAQSALWHFAGLAQPLEGRLDLAAQIRTDADWQQTYSLAIASKVTAGGFAYPGLPAPLDGEVTADIALDRSGATIGNIAGDLTGGLAPDWRSRIGGDLAIRRAAAQTSITGRLTFAGEGEALPLAAFGGGDRQLQQPRLALTTDLAGLLQPDGGLALDITLPEPAILQAARVNFSPDMALPDGFALSLTAGETPALHLTRDETGRIVADVTLKLGKTSIALEPKALGDRLILVMPSAALSAHYDSTIPPTAAFDLAGAQMVAPLHGITLGGVALNAQFDENGLAAKLSSNAVAGLGAFVPLRAEASANLVGDAARFTARFRGTDQPIDLQLTGKADLARGSGEIDLALAPIDFTQGGLQPYNLFPPLRGYFEDISGRVEAAGPIQFAQGDLTSDLKLGIENFSGKVGPVQLLNVNSVITIDKPWPLSTKPDQAIAIERADIGLPLTNALFRFKVSDGKRLDLAESRLQMSGGEMRLEPVTLDIDAPVHNLRLTVQQISVNELFASLGVAGLSGEGTISGAVPVSIFPGGIAIPAAELRADAPGVLRYDRDQAPLALQSAGESIAMALQALSDFHYKELILNLTRELTGDVSLGLHISGSNPSFYDGYPVEFNLTIQGRLDEALREGLAGYQVPDMIQEQLENLAP
ncbi:YdbH domain-containing protein [Dongia sp.]|uniref:intermembrane phospholipid transport protein YdbH family protein n=1 Tax=Dongia sp. TaxID=1977262 RepID=UPI0035AE337A